jgi:ribose transport system permease protein
MASFLRHYGSLIGMASIVLFFWIALPDTFMTLRNWLNISQQLSMLIVVAVTMTVVMVMGDFDLSVGAMASLSGVVAAVLFTQGLPVPVALASALAVGLLGGLANGVLVSLVGILPFVATLATMTIFSGAAFLVSGGKTIFGRDIPQEFVDFARSGLPMGTWGGNPVLLPALTVVAAMATLFVWVVLEHTTYAGFMPLAAMPTPHGWRGSRSRTCGFRHSPSPVWERRLQESCMPRASPRPIRCKVTG